MIEEHGLEEGLQELDMAGSDEHCFHGLNGLEFIPQHTIRLSWCSPRFDKVRTDDFYVVDEAPFDIILGMAVIREVNPFGPRQITALPLRRKDKTAGKLRVCALLRTSLQERSTDAYTRR